LLLRKIHVYKQYAFCYTVKIIVNCTVFENKSGRVMFTAQSPLLSLLCLTIQGPCFRGHIRAMGDRVPFAPPHFGKKYKNIKSLIIQLCQLKNNIKYLDWEVKRKSWEFFDRLWPYRFLIQKTIYIYCFLSSYQ